jgi:hypothetical protein
MKKAISTEIGKPEQKLSQKYKVLSYYNNFEKKKEAMNHNKSNGKNSSR